MLGHHHPAVAATPAPAPGPGPASDLDPAASGRRGDLLVGLLIALVVTLTSLPGACRERVVQIPRFEPLVLDPNDAPSADLQALPGIGRVLAGRIVAEAAREPFHAADDLLRVHGVGPKLLAGARPHLRFVPLLAETPR